MVKYSVDLCLKIFINSVWRIWEGNVIVMKMHNATSKLNIKKNHAKYNFLFFSCYFEVKT